MKKKDLLPPQILIIFMAGMVFFHFVFPINKIVFYPLTFLGLAIFLLGMAFSIWTDSFFNKYKTTIKPFEEPTSLITEGPFLFSRHPMYLSFIFILIGLAVMLGSLTPFVFPLLLFLVLEFIYVKKEEEHMKENFGQKYLDYKKRVRKWI